ncbi:hypothetical protein D3C78_902630 [compost metagenome]
MGTARHQVVTRAFRGGAGEDRRFHVEETVFIQEATDAGGDARTQTQLFGHFWTTQVDEAIAQAGFLADIGVFVERERRGLRLVEHGQLITQHFDGTGGHVGVHSASWTRTHLTGDLYHVFATHAVSGGEAVCAIRVEDDLSHAFAVTDIEENHPAVVAATMDPSAKGNFLTFQALVQLAAIMAAHHDGGFASRHSCVQWRS